MANTEKPTILYVDDEIVNLEMFRFAFRKSFKVKIAESGREALNLLKQDNSLELVLCDMKMPKMNGLEFVGEVKTINNKLPCIILSGYDKTKEVIDAIANKLVFEYIMKPFDKTELEQCIFSALKQ